MNQKIHPDNQKIHLNLKILMNQNPDEDPDEPDPDEPEDPSKPEDP
jgi:hypothetical protein